MKYFRYKRRKQDTYAMYRDLVFIALVFIAVVDIVLCLILFTKQYVANLIRPIVVLLCFRTQQDYWAMIALNVKDSVAMLACILIWVTYFAIFGNFIMDSFMEGIVLFPNI